MQLRSLKYVKKFNLRYAEDFQENISSQKKAIVTQQSDNLLRLKNKMLDNHVGTKNKRYVQIYVNSKPQI